MFQGQKSWGAYDAAQNIIKVKKQKQQFTNLHHEILG
jgi:hypothetical protein